MFRIYNVCHKATTLNSRMGDQRGLITKVMLKRFAIASRVGVESRHAHLPSPRIIGWPSSRLSGAVELKVKVSQQSTHIQGCKAESLQEATHDLGNYVAGLRYANLTWNVRIS